MPINQINSYSAGAPKSNTNAASNIKTEDFLKLLAAQMSNQDMMNPSTDTDFIAQLAQFTSLDAMQTLTQISSSQLGSSMIGKTVIVTSADAFGKASQDTGTVDRVNFFSGECNITVNGVDYPLSSVMEILNT